jgi:hypothetical protein
VGKTMIGRLLSSILIFPLLVSLLSGLPAHVGAQTAAPGASQQPAAPQPARPSPSTTPAPLVQATPAQQPAATSTPAPTGPAPANLMSTGTVLLARGSNWEYSYDQQTWSTGAAPFADNVGGDRGNCMDLATGTEWALSDPDTLSLRTTLTLSGPATGAVANVMIDDQISLTINGTSIGSFDANACGVY